jgi:hypothetical protein
MNRFQTAAAACGLLGFSLASSALASDLNKETTLTVDQPIQVQGVLLAPGQHVFKLAQPNADFTLVSIYNADQTQLEGTLMGIPAYRVNIDDKLFTVSQPSANQPAVLQAWYFPSSNTGVEFRSGGKTGQVAHTNTKPGQQNSGASENATH